MSDNRNIEGNVAVGRDVAVGGNATVQGDMTVGHGLNVRGWLDAPNIKGANKGVFSTEAKLKAAYPNPHEGWYAGVIDSTDVVLYIVDGGEWTSTSADYTGAFDAPEKADKVSGGTEDNFAALDAEGNIKDSGHKHGDYATKVSGGTSGNLASLGSDGNIADSGSKAGDFVVKVDGKGLSSEDYTAAEKTKLGSLPNGASLDTTLAGKENVSNKVTSLSSSSTDTQYPSAKCVYDAVNPLQSAVADARGYAYDAGVHEYNAKSAKNDAQAAKNDAVSAKNDAQAAQTAAETAQGAAETAARNAVAASGLAIGEAVRCTYTFASGGKKTLCASEGLQLMVIDGVGTDKNTYDMEEAGSVTASFVFADPTEIPVGAFKDITELKSVHIPSHVHSIGKNAFRGCSGIAAIDCESMTPPTVGAGAFDDVDTRTVEPKVHRVISSAYANWGGFTTIDTY